MKRTRRRRKISSPLCCLLLALSACTLLARSYAANPQYQDKNCLGLSGTEAPLTQVEEIRIARNGWLSADMLAYIGGILVKEKLGFSVRYIDEATTNKMPQMVAQNQIDVVLEFWPTGKEEQLKTWKATGMLEDVGLNGITARSGLFMPQNFAKTNPDMVEHVQECAAISYSALKSSKIVQKLQQCSQAAGKSECTKEYCTDNKFLSKNCASCSAPCGTVFHVNPNYDQGIVEEMINSFDLNLTVVYPISTYKAEIATLVAKDVPFVAYYWEPDPFLVANALQRVTFPPYHEGCLSKHKPASVTDGEVLCDFKIENTRKIVNAQLSGRALWAYQMAVLLDLDNEKINQMLKLTTVGGGTFDDTWDAACAWLRDPLNNATWHNWIPVQTNADNCLAGETLQKTADSAGVYKCTKCPTGTHWKNKTTDTVPPTWYRCEPCPLGTTQFLPGQRECTTELCDFFDESRTAMDVCFSLVLVLWLIALVWTVVNRSSQEVHRGGFELLLVILVGVLFITIGSFVIRTVDKVECYVATVFTAVGVDCIFACLIGKAWRVKRLFVDFNTRGRKITNMHIVRFVGLVVLIDCLLLGIMFGIVPFSVRNIEFCALKLCTTSSLAVTIVLVAYKICGFVPLWYLGIKTNKADRRYSEHKAMQTVLAWYTITTVGSVMAISISISSENEVSLTGDNTIKWMPIFHIPLRQASVPVILRIGAFNLCVVALVAVWGPRLYRHIKSLREKDEGPLGTKKTVALGAEEDIIKLMQEKVSYHEKQQALWSAKVDAWMGSHELVQRKLGLPKVDDTAEPNPNKLSSTPTKPPTVNKPPERKPTMQTVPGEVVVKSDAAKSDDEEDPLSDDLWGALEDMDEDEFEARLGLLKTAADLRESNDAAVLKGD